MSELYPPIEPNGTGMLDVGDGNSVYWEECGNPAGKAALVVHGGPGSGCTPGQRRAFDPARYRVVLFDQRMCGRWELARAWPGAELAVIERSGHSGSAAMTARQVAALDDFAG